MSIVLIVIYLLSDGGSFITVYPMDSFAHCYKERAKIVAMDRADRVTFKCRILHARDEI